MPIRYACVASAWFQTEAQVLENKGNTERRNLNVTTSSHHGEEGGGSTVEGSATTFAVKDDLIRTVRSGKDVRVLAAVPSPSALLLPLSSVSAASAQPEAILLQKFFSTLIFGSMTRRGFDTTSTSQQQRATGELGGRSVSPPPPASNTTIVSSLNKMATLRRRMLEDKRGNVNYYYLGSSTSPSPSSSHAGSSLPAAVGSGGGEGGGVSSRGGSEMSDGFAIVACATTTDVPRRAAWAFLESLLDTAGLPTLESALPRPSRQDNGGGNGATASSSSSSDFFTLSEKDRQSLQKTLREHFNKSFLLFADGEGEITDMSHHRSPLSRNGNNAVEMQPISGGSNNSGGSNSNVANSHQQLSIPRSINGSSRTAMMGGASPVATAPSSHAMMTTDQHGLGSHHQQNLYVYTNDDDDEEDYEDEVAGELSRGQQKGHRNAMMARLGGFVGSGGGGGGAGDVRSAIFHNSTGNSSELVGSTDVIIVARQQKPGGEEDSATFGGVHTYTGAASAAPLCCCRRRPYLTIGIVGLVLLAIIVAVAVYFLFFYHRVKVVTFDHEKYKPVEPPVR